MEEKGLQLFDKVFNAALKLPGAIVERDSFLANEFAKYQRTEELQGKAPLEVYSEAIVDRVAKSVCQYHLTLATSASFASGIPGGLALLGTVPADIAQQYYQLIIVAQKLAYIYGFPSLLDGKNGINDETKNMIMTFLGVMSGVKLANDMIKKIAMEASKQAAKRIPQIALTKYGIYNTAKQVARWIGISITKQSIGRGASKIVPILGGVISGGMTFIVLKPMMNKLRKKLKEEMYLLKDLDQSKSFSDIIEAEIVE